MSKDQEPDIENQNKPEQQLEDDNQDKPEQQGLSFGQRNPRLMGAAKTLISVPFLATSIMSFPASFIGFSLFGGGFILGGRLIRGLGWLIDSETMMNFGARVSDIGVKIALSPLYAASAATEGLYSIGSGQDISLKGGLIGALNYATDWISGINTEKAKMENLKQAANSNQKKMSQEEEKRIRADERKKLEAETKGSNSQQANNNNQVPQGNQGQWPQNPYPYPGHAAPMQQSMYPQQQGFYPQQQGAYPQQQGFYPQQQGYYNNAPMQQFTQHNYPNYNNDYSVHPIEAVHKANNLQEAQNNYMNFVNSNPENQFKQNEVEACEGGGYKVTWAHPQNPEQKVICYYDQEGRCLGAETDEKSKTSAILPPIYNSSNPKGFTVKQLNNGAIEDFVPERERNNNRSNALQPPTSALKNQQPQNKHTPSSGSNVNTTQSRFR